MSSVTSLISLIQCDVAGQEPGTLEFALIHEGVEYGPLRFSFEELVLTEIVPAREVGLAGLS